MSDTNEDVDMLDKYVRRIYRVLADSFEVDVKRLNLNEVSKFAIDYLRKATMPSTCALDYYNKYLANSTEDLRYSSDKNYDKFLHSVADYLETQYNIDKRKLAEFNSFPQKCFEHYMNGHDANPTAIKYYETLSKGQKDELPKLNTQTTDEKETKPMATDNQNANISAVAPIKKIDTIGMMKVKIAETMFKKDGELDYSKLMMMDAIGDDGKINLNKMIEAKMNGKIIKAIESGEDIPLEKLMILQAMQGGQIDYNQIYMYKIIGKMLDDDDDDKKAADKKAETK